MSSHNNNVRKIREERLMSKMELAQTKRKIIFALGFTLADKDKVFMD